MPIAKQDDPETICMTRYGSYKLLVMHFGFTNTPTIFCTLINKKLQLFLDKFVMVYIDNIVVYKNSLEKHTKHLQEVL